MAFPVPTVAAINGHAYAAGRSWHGGTMNLIFLLGMMLALGHDIRIMREDRGYLCLPEVDIHLPFSPGMAAAIAYLFYLSPHAINCDTELKWLIHGPFVMLCYLENDSLVKKHIHWNWLTWLHLRKIFYQKVIDHATLQFLTLIIIAIALAASLASKGDDKLVFGLIKQQMYKHSIEELNNTANASGDMVKRAMSKLWMMMRRSLIIFSCNIFPALFQ